MISLRDQLLRLVDGRRIGDEPSAGHDVEQRLDAAKILPAAAARSGCLRQTGR
jgi:hypothetical protein